VTRHAADESCWTAWRTLALWSAPLLLAPPMFSWDVYSYLAQGLMIDSGLDVYQHGPAVLGGMIADQVPAIWQHTPSAAIRHRPIVATLLVVGAALVKVPAALGLCAVALIRAAQLRGRWTQVRAGSAVIATAAAATILITAAAGTGYGWISTLGTPISPQNWSLTSALGRWAALMLEQDSVGATVAQGVWRWAGMLATLIVAGLVWTYRHRLGPVYGLGIVLVVFGPALRPWYLVWGLAPLAAVVSDMRVRRALAVLCAVLVLVTLPDGFAADAERVLLAVLGSLIGIAAFLAVRLAVAPATLKLARMSR
jgi:hypothetical protein